MELYQANHLSDHCGRENDRLFTELEEREEALQEHRMRIVRKREELKTFCVAVQKLKELNS